MPSQEAMSEMESTRTFKEKNMETAQRTMQSLQNEKKKREKELALLRDSEPKLNAELENLGNNMQRMENEMSDFDDVSGLRSAFDATKQMLLELRMSYTKRRDSMRQQVQVRVYINMCVCVPFFRLH
jgi:hypothetical protein